MSNIKFCDQCSNTMNVFIKDDEDNSLIYKCKMCDNQESIVEETFCVYSYDNSKIKRSNLLNTNEYLLHDVTLPKIQNNPNIKCPNKDCICNTDDAVESDIIYVKYDAEKLSYMYVCKHCDQKWTNR